MTSHESPVETFRVRLRQVELEALQAGWGDGPLVILLHGFPECRQMWRPFLPHIAGQGYIALAPDQRGYNRSSKPKGVGAYDLDALARDISELAEAFGRTRYHVIGHDWGASVGWWLASTRPNEVEGLLAFSAPHPAAWRLAMQTDPDQRRRSGYVRLLNIPLLPELLVRAGRCNALAQPLRPYLGDDELALYREAWAEPGALTGMINWYRALLRRRFGGLTSYSSAVPTWFVSGEDDPFLAPAAVHLSNHLGANVETTILPGHGHWLVHEDGGAIATMIDRFLASCRARDTSSKTPWPSADRRSLHRAG